MLLDHRIVTKPCFIQYTRISGWPKGEGNPELAILNLTYFYELGLQYAVVPVLEWRKLTLQLK